MMRKLLVMTDIHLTAGGLRIIGLDPEARFRAALAQALAEHGDAEALILMGDLTHHGAPEAYARLAEIVEDVPVPVIPMLGNHDDRTAFRAAFPGCEVTAAGHMQRVLDIGDHRVITLDTVDGPPYPMGHHAGHLCAERLAWLDVALAEAGERVCLVFAHHPPFATGIVGMDAIPLRNGDELLDRLSGRQAHLFCGHVHRTISGRSRDVSWTMFKSTCHQGPLDLVTLDSSLSIDEPGAYGVLLLAPDGVVAHSEDVLPRVAAIRDYASG
jgi:3',5'-cyclic AMP phosphodiesterase CpdA